MAAKTLSRKEQQKLALIDLAHEVLKTEKQPLPFQNIVEQIKDVKPLSEDGYEEQVARLYANMNLDGRFLNIGEVHWGLRGWYPFDQKEDDIEVPKPKRKRKRKKNVEEEDPEDTFEDVNDEDEDDTKEGNDSKN